MQGRRFDLDESRARGELDEIYIASHSAQKALEAHFEIHFSSENVCYLVPCQAFRDRRLVVCLESNVADT